MSFWIVGHIPKQYRKKWHDPPYSEVYSFDGEDSYQCDADSGESEDLSFRDGYDSLVNASKILQLVNPEKGQAMWDLIRGVDGEIFSKEKEDGSSFMNRQDIERVLSYLEELDRVALKLTDEKYHVRPEYVQYVLDNAPAVVQARLGESGSTVYDLGGTLAMIRRTAQFLQLALELDRDVINS
jgi:hypothetical protein